MIIKKIFLALMLTVTGGLSGFLMAADFECIRSSRHVEVVKTSLYTTDSLVYQVNSRNGERYSDFHIPYSKIVKVSKINAWLEDSKGNRLRELKKSEYQDRSSFSYASLYQDDRVKTFQIKHNKYPYRVCYTFTYTESQYGFITDWIPFDTDEYPTREARLYVTLPKNYGVRYFVENVPSLRSDTLNDAVVTEYLVKGNPTVSIISEDNLFDFNRPRVAITPLYFKMGVTGSLESWKTFGDWFVTLNKGLTQLPESELLKVNRMLQGITDTVSIIKTLYAYLQKNTRYVNVSIGIGGWKSFPASYVAQNKYGDCKALTNYMKALLECKGIKSYFVLINSGRQPHGFMKDRPCSQFNHVILTVPVGKDTIWLENTAQSMPFGYVGSYTQNRMALLVDEGKSRLILMPSLKKKDVECIRKMNFTFDENGNADFSAVFTNRSTLYESMNSFKNYCAEKDMGDYIDRYIPFGNYELKSWKFGETNPDSAKIDLQLNLTFPKFARIMGDNCYVRTFSIPESFKFHLPANFPVSIFWPVCNIDSSFFTIPSGYKLKALSDPVHMTSDFGDFVSLITVRDNKMLVYKKLEINSGNYSVREYEQLYAFLKTIKEMENSTQIHLTKIME